MSKAKLKKDEILAEDISEYLASKDDFALEMEVVRSCKENGISVEHGGTYSDPNRAIDRQFDIRAFFQIGWRVVRMAVECKAITKHFPLVVSRVSRQKNEAKLFFHLSTRGFEGPVTQVHSLASALYPEKAPVGKSVVQVGKFLHDEQLTGSDADAYDKWSQAISSCEDFATKAPMDYRILDQGESHTAVSIALPILVVPNETLWVIDYSDEGKVLGSPRLATDCSLFMGKEVSKGPKVTLSHLHIFTLDGFQKFLRQWVNNPRFSEAIFPKELDALILLLEAAAGFQLNK